MMVGNLNVSASAAFDRAVMLAGKSCMGHKHGCVILKGNTIIGEGYNRWTEHMEHSFSLHSEVVAISSVKNKSKGYLNDSVMIVVRIGHEGLKLSKPCVGCRKAIEKVGIGKIFYSQ